jgi:hypothetical protein
MKIINGKELDTLLNTQQIDYFISSSSFEDRCFGLSNHLTGFSFDKVLIFGNIDFDHKIIENRVIMADHLSQNSEVTFADLMVDKPEFSFISMVNECAELFLSKPKITLIDITTFTHEGLLMLFKLLITFKRPEDKLIFSYTIAKDYSSNVTENNDKWLSKGVKGFRSIIGYPGYSDPSKKNHLIVLFGFEKERTIRLIEEFDFEIVSLAFGAKNDSVAASHQLINEDRHSEILNLYSNAKKFELSLTDPYLAKSQILSYVQDHSEYNIVIAPMNNKISTIGAGLAAIENPDIQLFYMQANVYNTEAYSDTSDEFIFIDL